MALTHQLAAPWVVLAFVGVRMCCWSLNSLRKIRKRETSVKSSELLAFVYICVWAVRPVYFAVRQAFLQALLEAFLNAEQACVAVQRSRA